MTKYIKKAAKLVAFDTRAARTMQGQIISCKHYPDNAKQFNVIDPVFGSLSFYFDAPAKTINQFFKY